MNESLTANRIIVSGGRRLPTWAGRGYRVCLLFGFLFFVPTLLGGESRDVKVSSVTELFDALTMIRHERKEQTKPVTILLEDGAYAFTNKITLAGEDGRDITFRARNPGQVSFVGGRILPLASVRRLSKGDSVAGRINVAVRDRVRSVEVPPELNDLFSNCLGGIVPYPAEEYSEEIAEAQRLPRFPVFSIDGKFMVPARWPNNGKYYALDAETFIHGDEITQPDQSGNVVRVQTNNLIRCPNERCKRWNLAGANAFAYGFIMGGCAYACTWKRLVDFDSDGNLEIARGWGAVAKNSRMQFVNIMEELDEPGEWCYDSGSMRIYFIPPEGFSGHSVIALGYGLDHMLHVKAQSVRIEGINFWAKNGRPIICIEKPAYKTEIVGCKFSALDYIGVHAAGRKTTIRDCDFTDIMSSGVNLTGGDVRSELDWGGNVVENCLFDRCCMMKSGWAQGGVRVGGCGNRVAHCLFRNFPEQGCVLEGVGHVFEYNRLYDTATEFGDTAAVYCGWMGKNYGNVFRYNDIGSSPGYCNALYLDDGASGNLVYGNILRGFGNYGIFIGGGRDNIVSNNLITAGWGGLHIDNRGLFWPAYKDPKKIVDEMERRFSYRTGPIAAVYPKWAAWDPSSTKTLSGYFDNQWINNLILDVYGDPARTQICMGRRIDANRVHSTGNLFVSSTGSVTTNEVALWEFGGFRMLCGTKEHPIDLGFADIPKPRFNPSAYFKDGWVDKAKLSELRNKGALGQTPFRAGDFSVAPDARIFKELPGWSPIPFKDMGLQASKWRKTSDS